MSDLEQFGRGMRHFLQGFLGPSNIPPETSSRHPAYYEPERPQGYKRPVKPAAEDIVLRPNVSARMIPEQLLLTVQKTNSVCRYDPTSGEAEIVCQFANTPMLLWRAIAAPNGDIYCSLSGTRQPDNPFVVAFGEGGALLRVRPQDEKMWIIPGNSDLQDPGEMLLLDNGNLLVVDFQGFSGTGAIYEINPNSGERRTVATGGLLRDPTAATIGPDGALYVANASMQYVISKDDQGNWIKDTGNVLRVDMESGHVEVVYDETRDRLGAICGMARHPVGSLVTIIRNDWPAMSSSAILIYDLVNKEVKVVLESSIGSPRFFSHVPSPLGRTLYVADSYQKQMLAVDVERGEVIDRQPVHHILGPTVGMLHAFETIEAITIIPRFDS